MGRVDLRALRAQYLPQKPPDTPDTWPDNGQKVRSGREKELSGALPDTPPTHPTLDPDTANCRVLSGGVGRETRQSGLRAGGQKLPLSPQLSGVSGSFRQRCPDALLPGGLRETLLTLARAGHGLRLQGGRVYLDGGGERKDLLPLAPVLEVWPGGAMTATEVGALARLLESYPLEEVPSLVRGLLAQVEVREEGPPREPTAIRLLTSREEVAAVLPRLLGEPALGLDLETTGLDPHGEEVRLVSLATSRGEVFLLDAHAAPLAALGPLFGQDGPVLVGHNLRFDLSFLLAQGLWQGTGRRLFDTGLAHQLLHAAPRMPALGELAPWLDKTLQRSDWRGSLSKEQVEYAARDALAALHLYPGLMAALEGAGLLRVLDLELRALPAIAWMELSGVPFDPVLWEEAAAEAEREKEALLAQLPFGVNWNSQPQVLRYLRAEGLDLPDTREETLAAHRHHPLVDLLLRYRGAAKRLSTYGRDWTGHLHPKTGRIHPSWQQVGAETGRMSCRKPNLQQVPREPSLRRAFRPREGRVLVKADFSQIELRIAAQVAREGRMLRAFREGQDLHALTAALVLGKRPEAITKGDRQLAKALNFGLLYGLGAEGLRKYALTAYGVALSPEDAQQLRHAFFRAYPGLKRWHRAQPEGEVEVRTLAGRRRRTDRYTEKLNTPVQGTGADGLKLALALLWERRGEVKDTFPVLAVHDEIVVEAPEEEAQRALDWLTGAMREGMGLVLPEVPVEVEGGVFRDWGVSPWQEEVWRP